MKRKKLLFAAVTLALVMSMSDVYAFADSDITKIVTNESVAEVQEQKENAADEIETAEEQEVSNEETDVVSDAAAEERDTEEEDIQAAVEENSDETVSENNVSDESTTAETDVESDEEPEAEADSAQEPESEADPAEKIEIEADPAEEIEADPAEETEAEADSAEKPEAESNLIEETDGEKSEKTVENTIEETEEESEQSADAAEKTADNKDASSENGKKAEEKVKEEENSDTIKVSEEKAAVSEITYKIVTENGKKYCKGSDNTLYYGLYTDSVTGKTMYFDPENDGAAVTLSACVVEKKARLFDKDGYMVTGTGVKTVNGKKYYLKNSILQTGWRTVSGNKMYFDSATYEAVTGIQKIGGNAYLFSTSGNCYTGTKAVTVNGKKYGLIDDILQRGWTDINGKKMYLDPTTYEAVKGVQKIGSHTYLFSSLGNCYLGTKTITLNGNTYYIKKSKLQKGWNKVNGKMMYFDPKTFTSKTGICVINSKARLFDNNGFLITGTKTPIVNGKKYFIKSSVLQSGWITLSGMKLYFNKTTYAAAVGITKIGSKTYLFNDDGVLQNDAGIITYGGKKYLTRSNGSLKTGWYTLNNGNTMYFDKSTFAAVTGIVKVDNSMRLFDKSGYCVQGTKVVTLNGKKYAVKKGILQSGWATINGHKMYLNPKTYEVTTGITKINGKMYLFTDEGYRISGTKVATINGKKYCVINSVLQSGWATINGHRMYLDRKTYEAKTGIQKIGSKMRLFSSDGYCYLGTKTITLNGKIYCIKKSVLQSGWTSFKGKNMYLDPTTYAAKTGVCKVASMLRLFDDDGFLITGTKTPVINGRKYYIKNSIPQRGWVTMSGMKLYFNKTTYVAVTGITKIGKKTYLFNDDGVLQNKAGIVKYDGKKYLTRSNGTLRTGWYTANGKKYHFNTSTFAADTGKVVIDGKTYNFNSEGVLAQSVIQSEIDSLIAQKGRNLKTLYDWCAKIQYVAQGDTVPAGYTFPEWYAKVGFEQGVGDCRTYAGTFFLLAKELGYNVRYLWGYVPSGFGWMNTHAWVELILDGQTYVVDPCYEYEIGLNGYMFAYKTPNTWKYTDGVVIATS